MDHLSGTYRGWGKDGELMLRLDIDGTSPLYMLSGELNQSMKFQGLDRCNLLEHPFIGDEIIRTEEGDRLVLTTPVRFFRLPELTGVIEVEIQPREAMARLKLTGYGSRKQPLSFSLQKASDGFLLAHRSMGNPRPAPSTLGA
jgi:hypothetical protein